MEEESWILSTSMPGIIETPKIDKNTKIPEDFRAVIYDITYAIKKIEISLETTKRKHIKKIEK